MPDIPTPPGTEHWPNREIFYGPGGILNGPDGEPKYCVCGHGLDDCVCDTMYAGDDEENRMPDMNLVVIQPREGVHAAELMAWLQENFQQAVTPDNGPRAVETREIKGGNPLVNASIQAIQP